MEIKHALIGAGGFGAQHLKTIRELQREGVARLVAVCDPAMDSLPEVREDLVRDGIRIYADYMDLLEEEGDLTSLTIAAPIPLHHRMARACIERDLFVYLEKPPVPLLMQLDELISADSGRRIAVGFNRIESDWSRRIKQWIVKGSLGELTDIRVGACWPRADRYYSRTSWAGRMTLDAEPVFDGPATNALAHLIHNIMYFASDRPNEFDEPVEVQGEMYRARPIESYDTACLRGCFASGTRFVAALSHASQTAFPFEMHLTGTRGWARVSGDGLSLDSSMGSFETVTDFDREISRTCRSFFDYVSGRADRPSTFLRDTRGYTVATNAMLCSSGGIHPIGGAFVEQRETDGVSTHHVPGLDRLIAESCRNSRLFSESDVPWAVGTPAVATRDISLNALRACLLAGRSAAFAD